MVAPVLFRPIFASLGLEGFRSCFGLEGYRFWSQAYCLWDFEYLNDMA